MQERGEKPNKMSLKSKGALQYFPFMCNSSYVRFLYSNIKSKVVRDFIDWCPSGMQWPGYNFFCSVLLALRIKFFLYELGPICDLSTLN